MKKTILSVILVIAMLATCALSVFAHDPFTYEVKQYNATVVKPGTIKIDGLCDEVYYSGTKVTNDDEACHDGEFYKRGSYYEDTADGTFESYIAVDTAGLYVWVKVNDNTMFETLDQNGNSGDYVQLYFDWVPAEQQHPSAEELYRMKEEGAAWDYGPYKGLGIGGMQYIGWISFDYTGVISGSAGFSPVDSLGETGEEAIQYAATRDDMNHSWTGEVFIPWRDQEQKDAVAANKYFPCGIGFQVSDQTTINDEITEANDHSACLRFEQCRSYGLSYWADYSLLSDVVWGEGPVNPDTSDSVIAIVATLVVAGAGLAIISKKRG